MELRLRHFRLDFGDRPIAAITVEEMTTGDALSKVRQRAAPITCKHWRIVSYAVKRRMLGFNPVLHTAKRKLIDTPPEIFGVNELRGLLGAAQRTEPSVLLMLAIGAFAGLREAEI